MKKNIAYYVKEIDELRQQVNQLADENEKLKKELSLFEKRYGKQKKTLTNTKNGTEQ